MLRITMTIKKITEQIKVHPTTINNLKELKQQQQNNFHIVKTIREVVNVQEEN